jgi:hypothetical protein
VGNEGSRDILVCGYTDFPENSCPSKLKFVPVNMRLDPETGTITGTHTPIYNPLIDAELEQIFIGNSIYVGMDFYVAQIEDTMHFPLISLLIEALYDLYGNLMSLLSRYWPSIRIPAVEPETVRRPAVHYDYFCGTTYLSQRLDSAFSNQLSVFVKVNGTSKTIEDCWISRFSAFPSGRLYDLFCSYRLDEDPGRIIEQINTYYRITASKAMINVFLDVVKNCRAYYADTNEF